MIITLDIDDKFNDHFSEYDLKMFAAVGLYEKGIMCTSDLAKAVGMSRADFILEMGKYGESIFNLSEEEINRDVKNAKRFFSPISEELRLLTKQETESLRQDRKEGHI
jgi:predicted HTH domain antitoxin